LLGPEHRPDPCGTFNPGRESVRLKKRLTVP
jgi:hypothetical protein